jgi:mandelate racemase
MQAADVAREAAARAEQGFTHFKVKIGLADLDTDIRVIRTLRETVGADVEVAVDYNQSLTVADAVRRIGRLDAESLLWVEEPTHADDYAGHREIRQRVATPIQLGESWWSTQDFATSITMGAADLAMIDVMRIGGVTGWCEAAGLAAGHNIPLSSHLFPEVSAHLLATSPSGHLLEYLDLAGPVLDRAIQAGDGHVTAHDQPGIGVNWNESAVERYLHESDRYGGTMEWLR